jgi:hypothetical protein
MLASLAHSRQLKKDLSLLGSLRLRQPSLGILNYMPQVLQNHTGLRRCARNDDLWDRFRKPKFQILSVIKAVIKIPSLILICLILNGLI